MTEISSSAVFAALRDMLPAERKARRRGNLQLEVRFVSEDGTARTLIVPPAPPKRCLVSTPPEARNFRDAVGPPEGWWCECAGVCLWGSARNACDHPGVARVAPRPVRGRAGPVK